jgi:predicted dehydrogenase
MSVTGILGSGFGLYGWLPAQLAASSGTVALPQRYRQAFNARGELAAFAQRITWLADEAAVLARASTLVLAVRPKDQQLRALQCLAHAGIKTLILEKPLAPSPREALEVHAALCNAGRRFEVGYTFGYTPWGRAMLENIAAAGAGAVLTIHWAFLAHHYRHALQNWKRSHAAGGGALRFYGIQLLARAGYCAVSLSATEGTGPDDCASWRAALSGPGLPACEVAIDSRRDTPSFMLKLTDGAGRTLVDISQADPFDNAAAAAGTADRRIGLLAQICTLAREEAPARNDWYEATLLLWQQAEHGNSHEKAAPGDA